MAYGKAHGANRPVQREIRNRQLGATGQGCLRMAPFHHRLLGLG
jgi:hypothetical protein